MKNLFITKPAEDKFFILKESFSHLRKICFLSVSIMILTLAHHAYGAIIYDALFRLHVAYLAIPVILLLVITYMIFLKSTSNVPLSGKIAFWLFQVTVVFIPVGIIGLYEGGYNHLLKNILYFGGTYPATLSRLFPPGTYEMPNDFLFETTGILQFFFSIFTIYHLVEFWKKQRR